jgi:2,3-bisphosphoglycerate-dependent phosphoglycerate mutase
MHTTIVLVRHADSVRPTVDGPDEYHRPLSTEGLGQARDLAKSLAALEPAAIWSSPYLRAVQTVAPAAALLQLPVQTREDLREWDHAFIPTSHWAELVRESWDDPAFARPGGESLNDVSTRAAGAIRALVMLYPGQTVLVGSHGTFVSRALSGLGLTGVDGQFLFEMPMPAVYHLRFWDTFSADGPGL